MEKYLYKPNNQKNGYNLVMAYPAIEEFALSSLGYLWLFMIANTKDGISAERAYTNSKNVLSQNTDGIAFSLSFDFDFMGVFEILEKNKIPFYSAQRDDSYPLIFAGGPVLTTNPEPLKKFFDFMMIGDGEDSFPQVLDILKQKKNKAETLRLLSEVEGVYVPKFSKSVKKSTATLDKVIYTPILSEKSYFKDTFIIEVARGCMNRCAFCTASYLNLPFRSYPYDKIIEAIDLGLEHTNKIALLGAQISAHPDFNKIMSYIKNKMDEGMEIELGISSLRTDSVTPELVQTLVQGGQKTSTIAIESASEKLRKFINKNLKDEQIFNAVKTARENGLKGLKIYSMIGIPNETQEDIESFLRLGEKLKKENKGFELTFSFSTFVPKPQTPLQWSIREESKSLEKKQKFLEKGFAKLGISAKFSSIKWDYWQSFLSRGDENLDEFLVSVYKKGGKLGAYKSALKELNISQEKYIHGLNLDKNLPWDIIENYPPKKLLQNELNRLNKKL
jgi:radical SAM superfamily enzyme YgiQ (UPF0313 family)